MSLVQKRTEASKWYLPGILSGMGWTIVKMVKNLSNQKEHDHAQLPRAKTRVLAAFQGQPRVDREKRRRDSLYGVHALRDELPGRLHLDQSR